MTVLGPHEAAERLMSTIDHDEIERYDRNLWTHWVEAWLASADETWPLHAHDVLNHVERIIRERLSIAMPSAEHP